MYMSMPITPAAVDVDRGKEGKTAERIGNQNRKERGAKRKRMEREEEREE